MKEVQGERKRKVWGDNDPMFKRMFKERNEKRKLYPSCAKCGKNHKGDCLWGSNVCFRCGKLGHHVKECRVKNIRLQGQVGQRALHAQGSLEQPKDSLSLATTSRSSLIRKDFFFPHVLCVEELTKGSVWPARKVVTSVVIWDMSKGIVR